MSAHVAGLQSVTVWSGLRRAGRRGGAAGANDVLDDDRLTERLLHMAGDDTRDDVRRSACRKWHNHRDVAGWVILRVRERNRCDRSEYPSQKCSSFHVVLNSG